MRNRLLRLFLTSEVIFSLVRLFLKNSLKSFFGFSLLVTFLLVLRPFHPPRGVLGPFGPKVGSGVENEFPGPSGPGVPKVKNRVEKESKKWKFQLFFNFFDSFSTLFLTFWSPGPSGPGNSFSTPFPTLGPKGPRTPLGGWKGRNTRYFFGGSCIAPVLKHPAKLLQNRP